MHIVKVPYGLWPSAIFQSFAVEEGRHVLRSERYLFTELSDQQQKKFVIFS